VLGSSHFLEKESSATPVAVELLDALCRLVGLNDLVGDESLVFGYVL
jgi:hypothetical protein